jgi:hypothetical protein
MEKWVYQDVDQHRISGPRGLEVPSAQFEFEAQRCASKCFGCVLQATPEPAVPSAMSNVTEVISETTAFADEVTGVKIGKSAAFAMRIFQISSLMRVYRISYHDQCVFIRLRI